MTQARPPFSAEALRPGETGEREGYQAANSNQHFDARFDAQGACVVSDGTHWNLSVREWGYGDPGSAEGFADSPSRSAMAERGASAGLDLVEDFSCSLSVVSRLSSDVWYPASGV